MKKQWFQKEQIKTGKKDEKKDSQVISGRNGYLDLIKESQMPLNVHKRQRFDEKKFYQVDGIMTLIIPYLLTKENDSQVLLRLSHVCKSWQKLTVTDPYWRPTLGNLNLLTKETLFKTLPENTEKDKKLSNRQLWLNLCK
jgi:hypothetical protein